MPTLKSTNKSIRKIAITTGDPDGIGFEVSCKALFELGPQKNTVFFLFRNHSLDKKQNKYLSLLDKKFVRLTFNNLENAFSYVENICAVKSFDSTFIIDLALKTSAPEWVIEASQFCLNKKLAALVTGPLSKTLIKNSGFSFMGHTGAFKSLCPNSKLNMAFAGNKFNVLLATDHISFADVPKKLTAATIQTAIKSARLFKKLIKSNKKIAILGLNPHAGESGLLGSFEKKYLSKLPKDVVGPLVPDTAFLKKNWNQYSVFISLYHDQGLIPFKIVHGQDSGVHITIGLPFLRTSVDHGTAKDIYNKNLANHASMLDAIRLNLKLVRGNHV